MNTRQDQHNEYRKEKEMRNRMTKRVVILGIAILVLIALTAGYTVDLEVSAESYATLQGEVVGKPAADKSSKGVDVPKRSGACVNIWDKTTASKLSIVLQGHEGSILFPSPENDKLTTFVGLGSVHECMP